MAGEDEAETPKASVEGFVMAAEREPPAVTVDVGHIIHSQQLFAVLLGEVTPFAPPEADRPRIAIPRASLRLTPAAFYTVVRAMASNWNKWSAAHLEDGPRFSLSGRDGPLEHEPEKDKA